MSKFISRVFRVLGVILIIWTALMVLFGGLEFYYMMIFIAMEGLVGLLLLYMGKSMKRLANGSANTISSPLTIIPTTNT